VAVETCEDVAMPWDRVHAMATPGRVFDMFTNQGHALRGAGERRPGGTLKLFAGAQAAAALSQESDEVITERFLADLYTLFPQSRGVIADARTHRWQLGNVYAHPGRHRLQAPLEGALGPRGNHHLAGDYFAERGTLEAAAERVKAHLQQRPTHVREPA
jgi:oxygen-dependent protoporphyrinogen oxidase